MKMSLTEGIPSVVWYWSTVLGFAGLLEPDETEKDRGYRVRLDERGLHCHDRASRCHLHILRGNTYVHYQVPVNVRFPGKVHFSEECIEGLSHLLEPVVRLLSRGRVVFFNNLCN